jgi:hypothetical protein
MMRLKVENQEPGLHPSEVAGWVSTRTGPEEVVFDATSLKGGTVDVGWPVGRDGSYFLVELPRPTPRGLKRLWVEKDALISDETYRASA